jgi:DNA-directed RNA polymerase specialized sigma24 family protein
MNYNLTASTISQVLNYIAYYSGFTFVKEMCERNGQLDGGDLYQDLFLIVADYPPSKILNIFNAGQMQYWLSGVIINQTHSSTSPFFKNYKKALPIDEWAAEVEWGDIEKDIQLSEIEKALSKLDWYDREVFKMYFYERKSYRAIQKETKIHYTAIGKTVRQTIENIKRDLAIPLSKPNLKQGCNHLDRCPL